MAAEPDGMVKMTAPHFIYERNISQSSKELS